MIDKLLVTYSLKGIMLQSGNKVEIAQFETSKLSLTCSVRITTKLFYLLTPDLGAKSNCSTNGTPLTLMSPLFDICHKITICGAPWHNAYRTWSSP